MSERKGLKSVVFENGSGLEQIEEKTFSMTGLDVLRTPASIEGLSESCFYQCSLNHCRDCHELKGEHLIKVAWLK
jgi:hypothetical protein